MTEPNNDELFDELQSMFSANAANFQQGQQLSEGQALMVEAARMLNMGVDLFNAHGPNPQTSISLHTAQITALLAIAKGLQEFTRVFHDLNCPGCGPEVDDAGLD